MKQKQWIVAERLAEDLREHLLRMRVGDEAVAEAEFLFPSLNNLSSPQSFANMNDAVARIAQAIQQKEPMVVWGDFDADGVTSTAILWETLHQLGANVLPYIPNRDTEGHGFSDTGLKKIQTDGTKLIITVDHGIAAIEAVEQIKSMGMDVIITDHHEPRLRQEFNHEHMEIETSEEFDLPEAIAVVHPLLMDHPQPLAGCGVAYMLAYAVWLAVKQRQDDETARKEFASDKIELAAIGTIADMVPLIGDNRILAAYGLQALIQTQRPGLQAMYATAGLKDKKVFGAYEVGFGIGPRLNAPGRLADALESLRLLCTRDVLRAKRLAEDLNDLNKQRQDLLGVVAEAAKTEVLKHADGVYVLAHPDWPAGVCGLAAGKIVEQYYRPTVVMEQQGELSRGSARSIKGFDITEALTKIADLLESYGGHAMAAGFVARTERLEEIERRLSELLWQQFDRETLQPSIAIDAEIALHEFNWELFEMLQQFEPCGMGNPKTVFVMRQLQVQDYKVVGSDGKHVKLTLCPASSVKRDASNGPQFIEAIAFNFGNWIEELQKKPVVDVVFGVDKNEWNGKSSLQLMVKDMRLSEPK